MSVKRGNKKKRFRSRFRKGGPGGPGRPKGRKNNATLIGDTKAKLAAIFESEGYFRMVQRKATAGQLPGPVWRFYLEMLHGKPRQGVDLTGRVTLEEVLEASRG